MKGGDFGSDKLKSSSSKNFLPGGTSAGFTDGVPTSDVREVGDMGKWLPCGHTQFTAGVSSGGATARSMGKNLPAGERGFVKGV